MFDVEFVVLSLGVIESGVDTLVPKINNYYYSKIINSLSLNISPSLKPPTGELNEEWWNIGIGDGIYPIEL